MNNYIDPNLVPKRRLANGDEIPCIGMGTFGSDRFTAEQVSNAVAGAIRCGYRLFDCCCLRQRGSDWSGVCPGDGGGRCAPRGTGNYLQGLE